MKKIFLWVALIATTSTQLLLAQDTKSTALAHLLASYYDIKDALVKSNTAEAATHAAVFLKAVNSVDMKSLPVAEIATFVAAQEKLALDSRRMSESKDIAFQRGKFANFSNDFYKLAKAIKVTDKPIYYAYCPMKKSNWLSSEPGIKNPYYGSSMLTCGQVIATIK